MSNATPRQRVRLTPEAAATAADTVVPHVPSGEKAKGDKRPPGRPPGARNRLSNAARAHAEATGELPHIFLLRITRGEVISTDVMDPVTGQLKKVYQVPDLPMRMDAAKAAAPYFAPKLSAVEVTQAMSDEELDLALAQQAARLGMSLQQFKDMVQPASLDNDEQNANADGWLPEVTDDADGEDEQ